ncbi:MAG TPA: glycoside hydrolase family 3 C-terminal domain-containing protein [Terracidiphilus sp.]|nr:glycoside hydrolase family 3 C-terminal domain-containing protein [Terracidiphilus sp.]
MKISGKRILAAFAGFFALTISAAFAQDNSNLPYMNPKLPAEERAADLVHRMTLQEKASQLVNDAQAIPRLNVPAYNWWSEALHGVIDQGVTEFPEPIGLAATFDVESEHAMGTDIGIEGRIKHLQDVKAGHDGIMGGLDFWAPNLNIFRDPRWGRGQETYGEDPFLTGRMGVAFVSGMQGNDPNHYLVIATPKHYDVHSGPEPTRHFADVDVSKHDELDTYEPGFRAAVVEGKAGSIMCAYNAINGEPACANEYLLQDQLRGKWGFQGYVVSDCDAVRDMFTGHRYGTTQAQASAISLIRGMDNECYGGGPTSKDDSHYKPFIEAVQQGYLPESAVDTTLVRLFTARMKLGMFDPPELDPYSKIDEKELDSPEHRALARKMANESMVLLKNDGTLPLKPSVKRIAVIGPLAEQTRVLLGNYAGTPTHSVSVLDGLKAEFPNASITYVAGTQFLGGDGDPVPDNLLTTPDGKPGLKADYSESMGFRPRDTGGPALASRVEKNIDLDASSLPAEAAGKKSASVHWTGFITAPDSGDYLIGVRGQGFARVTINDKQVAMLFSRDANQARLGKVHLEKGQKAALSVLYGYNNVQPHAQLIWAKSNDFASPESIAAAKNADVVVAVVGITSELEGEEMPVTEPGFLGGDRTSIDLPAPEENLVEGLAATGKPLVVVLMNGSALAVNWINDHANAVLEAWYSGEEGGTAIAETLSGKNNPGGRLPVTFYKSLDQLPNFENYSMEGRTYRYFKGAPLYPFGYGLSYTTFSYSNLSLPTDPIQAGGPLHASVTVTNTGKLAGDEVVQLYLKFPDVPGAPLRALRGFQRVHLDPGASQNVDFQLNPRDLSMVTDDGMIIVAQGNYTVSIGGGQPGTGAPSVSGNFKVDGRVILPE